MRISKYSSSRRFASDLLQFCLQLQEQFCNKTFPGEKNTYRKLRKQIPADVYFQAILKWAKSEGLENAFLLKKWRKKLYYLDRNFSISSWIFPTERLVPAKLFACDIACKTLAFVTKSSGICLF